MVKQQYSLGSSTREQERLQNQIDLYGDTHDIAFGATEIVCDIGCGPGSDLWIAKQVSKGKYIGLDINKNQIDRGIETAKQLGLSNAEFHVIDGRYLDLPDQSTDATFARCVLIHQPDPQIIAREMYRVTKPGGRLIVIEPHAQTYYCTPAHEHLLKCYRARVNYVYGNGKGSADIALNLYPLFKSLSLKNITVRCHIISVFGEADTERSKALLNNWLGQIESVSDALLSAKLVTKKDLKLAHRETQIVSSDTFIYQSLWIAEGIK